MYLLTIRDAQLRALTAASRAAFVARAFEHVGQFFPVALRQGEDVLTAHIEASIELALAEGIERESDLLMHLDLTLTLGLGLYSDPELAWVASLLREQKQTPRARVSAAHAELVRRVALAEDNRAAQRAFRDG